MYWHRRDRNRSRGVKPTLVRKEGAIASFIDKEVKAQVAATRHEDFFKDRK